MPSGFDVGPALTACTMCLPRYSTGNATDKTIGAWPDSMALASWDGSSSSPRAQGSEAASCPQAVPAKVVQASIRTARNAPSRKLHAVLLVIIGGNQPPI